MQTIRASAAGPRGLEWLRAAAASVALFALLGVGHVLPALHFALIAHRICAEHGELVHELAAAPAVASRSSVPEVAVGERSAHEHEHCGVLALTSSSAPPLSEAASLPARDGEPSGSDVPAALSAHVGIELLLYAPKLAPPV